MDLRNPTNSFVGGFKYTKVSGNKKITINKKTGKVTVKKGLKKGTYNVNYPQAKDLWASIK